MMLFAAALSVPIAGRTDSESVVLHRVNMDGLPVVEWETAEYCTAVCGSPVKLMSRDGDAPVEWRHLRTRGTKFKRCPTCNGRVA
jgi:hypothetical protein